MSRSTTATTTYDLVKYSRSSTNGRPEAEQEWQHFTNPTITLVVDAKKSGSGELECFRTRVVWALAGGKDSMDVDQREVVFEDLDMHVLSLTPLTYGLPLKAVYRDTVVGIRYMHPRTVPVGSQPTFRRFQITFQTPELAAAFIDSIKLICPCKTNVTPVGRNIQMARSKTVITGMASTQPVPATAHLTGPAMPPKTPTQRIQRTVSRKADWCTPFYDSGAYPQTPGSSSQTMFPVEKLPALTDRITHAYMPTQSHIRPGLDDANPSSQATMPTHAPAYSQPQTNVPARPFQSSQPSDYPRYSRPSSVGAASSAMAADYSGHPYSDMSQSCSDGQPTVVQPAPGYTATLNATYHSHAGALGPGITTQAAPVPAQGFLARPLSGPPMPTPLQPLSSGLPQQEPVVAVPASGDGPRNTTIGQSSAPSHILSALEDTRSIYDLSRVELESLVARVVREDGFVKLLEKVDSMWAIKGCLDRTT